MFYSGAYNVGVTALASTKQWDELSAAFLRNSLSTIDASHWHFAFGKLGIRDLGWIYLQPCSSFRTALVIHTQ